MLLDSFFIKENFDKIEININELKLKKLKNRILNYEESLYNSTYLFFENSNNYRKIKNSNIYIPNILLNDFLFNITPYGLKKLSKNIILDIEEIKRRKKEIMEEQKRKERKKENPGIDGMGVSGPGEIK